MSLKVVLHPSSILSTPVQPITTFDEDLEKLAINMFSTMWRENGIGLAATQVGLSIALCVIDITETKTAAKAYVNPKILDRSEPTTSHEGCLSLPGAFSDRHRFNKIKVQYQDLVGVSHTEDLKGLMAIAMQHECDHLDGKLYIDIFGPVKKRMLVDRYKKHVKMLSRQKE